MPCVLKNLGASCHCLDCALSFAPLFKQVALEDSYYPSQLRNAVCFVLELALQNAVALVELIDVRLQLAQLASKHQRLGFVQAQSALGSQSCEHIHVCFQAGNARLCFLHGSLVLRQLGFKLLVQLLERVPLLPLVVHEVHPRRLSIGQPGTACGCEHFFGFTYLVRACSGFGLVKH